jgi:hypothetical protein
MNSLKEFINILFNKLKSMQQNSDRTDSRNAKFFVVLSPKGAPVAKLNFLTLAENQEYEEWVRSESIRMRQRYQQKMEEEATNEV